MTNLDEFLANLPKDMIDKLEATAQENINNDKSTIHKTFFSQAVRKEPVDYNDIAKVLKRHFNNRIDFAFNIDGVRFRVMLSCRDLPKENEKKEEEAA